MRWCRIILQSARTGDIGDGRIFVLPIEDGHNIRTGLRDAVLWLLSLSPLQFFPQHLKVSS
jgi:hypothetical protein